MGGRKSNNQRKQAQKRQADMAKRKEELESREYKATSGGGAVTAVVKGKTLVSLTISPDVIDPEDSEMLSDLVLAAVNTALKEAEEAHSSEMGKLTGGLGGMF